MCVINIANNSFQIIFLIWCLFIHLSQCACVKLWVFSVSIVSYTVMVPYQWHRLLEWFQYTVKVTGFLLFVLRLSARCYLPTMAFILSLSHCVCVRLLTTRDWSLSKTLPTTAFSFSNLVSSSTCHCVWIKLFECLASVLQWWFHVSVRVAGMVSVHC